MMKKILSLVLSLVMVFGVGVMFNGCKVDKDTIRIWWGPGDNYTKPLKDALERYKKGHDDFTYKIETQSSAEYYDKLSKQLSSDKLSATAPDIFRIAHTNVQTLGSLNRLANLSELGADSEKDKFLDSAWNANGLNGKTYAFPLDANTVALMYNKKIFEECGITNPPTTWQEFLDTCATLKAKGRTPFDLPTLSDSSGFTTFMFTQNLARLGGSIMKPNGTETDLTSDEAIEVVTRMQELKAKGYINGQTWQESAFYKGDVAMLEMGSWNLNQINMQDYGVTAPFTWDDKHPAYTTLGLYSLGIKQNSDKKQKAYEVCKFLATDKQFQLDFAKSIRTLPSLKSGLDDEFYNRDDEWTVYKNQLFNTVYRPGTAAWYKVQTSIQLALEKALKSGVSATDALAEAKENSDREINLYL